MKKTYIVGIAFLAFIFSMILAKPKTDEIRNMLTSREKLWQAIDIKKENLTDSLTVFAPASGEAKYVFRLTIPAIMKVLHLSRYHVYVLQIVMGFLIFLIWTIISSSFLDTRQTLISSLALAGVYYGKAFNIDSGTPVNTFSYFLILFAILFRDRLYLFIPALAMLFFNDERGIVSYSIIGLFIVCWDRGSITDIRSVVLHRSVLALAGTFIVCLAGRLVLQSVYGMHTPGAGVGVDVFVGQWKNFQFGLFSGIAGFWAVILYGIWVVRRQYLLFTALSAVVLLFICSGAIVSDITKSIAYLTPVALLSMKKIQESDDRDISVNSFALIINIIFPTAVVVGTNSFFYYNYIFDIVFKVLGTIYKI